MSRGSIAAIAGVAFSAASLWALRLVSTIHWQVVFGARSAHAEVQTLTTAMDELDVFRLLLAVVALAFGILAISDGKPRWLVWASFAVTLAAAASNFVIQ